LAAALDIPVGRLLDDPPPQKALDRHELDDLARAAIRPGTKSARGKPGVRILSRLVRDRRRALGLYKPRRSSPANGFTGKHAARWMRARLGEAQWAALLKRIDKLASLHAG
jgi:hypothetical protein